MSSDKLPVMDMPYRDDHLIIDEDGITIQDYYFPFSSKKVIPWERLKSARRFDVTLWTGKYRIWGMGLRPYWFHCDGDRPNKTVGFILDTDSFIKSAITPDSPEKVQEILSQRNLLK
jgi:hypothetical protein